tara:strand:- start:202 stop:753 length:552 start_codon:yes stop_codon:yes gene_type:complete
VSADEKVEHRIAVFVNEEIITSYDIVQRLKLNAIMQNININSQNNQLMINNAVDQLIQEKLKSEKINEYKIQVDDDEYLDFETDFFNRNSIDKSQLLLLLSDNNIDYQNLRELLIGELSWNKLISGLYYRITSVGDLEINEILEKNPNISLKQAENLVIQRQLDLQSSKLLRDMMNEATIEYR